MNNLFVPAGCVARYAVVVGLIASTPYAQETGSISGVVADETGGVLPGSNVYATSVTGTTGRSAVTGALGGYVLHGLPVGRYLVRFESQAFAAAYANVTVEARSDVQLDVTLELSGVSHGVEVHRATPLLDRKRSGVAATVDQKMLQGVPNGRSPWVVIENTPAVVLDRFDVGGSEAGQQSLFSATGTAYTQNQYSVNGVNATDPDALGASSTYYSYDSFEEIQVSTSGHPAEIQTPGVFLNIVLKSGTNQFRGGGAFYLENDTLQADNLDDSLRARGVAQSNKLERYLDYSLELGGPIRRDRAFFYVNFARQQIDPFVIGFFLPTGEPGIDKTRLTTFVARATVSVTTRDDVSVLFFRNNKFRPFRGAGRFRPTPETALYQDSTTDLFQVLYRRTLGSGTLFDVRISFMDMFFPLGEQPDASEDAFSRLELTSGVRRVGPGDDRLFERDRFQTNASLYFFRDDLLGGSHDFKLGWQQSYSAAKTTFDLTGSILYRDFFGVPIQVELSSEPLTTENYAKNFGLYAQDNFILGRLALNLGLRFDRWSTGFPSQSRQPGPWEQFFNARGLALETEGESGVVVWNSLAPRLGFTYSLLDGGKTLLRGGYARYYHQIGTGLAAFRNPNARAAALFDFRDANGNGLLDPGEINFDAPLAVNLPSDNVIDPAIRQPMTEELTFGIEHELGPDFTVGATLIYRKDKRITDDVNTGVPFSEYDEAQAVDPGRDLVVGTGDDSLITVFNQSPESLGRDRFELTNPEGLDSRYRGIMFEARKRYSNRWQMLASVVLSESDGLLPGPGLEKFVGTGFATPLYDNPNTLTNAAGRTYWDRPRVLRIAGSYDYRFGLRFAGALRSSIGQPLYRSIQVIETTTGALLNQGPIEIVAEPQGAIIQPSVHILDVRAEKNFDFGTQGQLGLMFDVFNVFNANTATEISARRGAFGTIVKILPPRVARIGLRYRF